MAQYLSLEHIMYSWTEMLFLLLHYFCLLQFQLIDSDITTEDNLFKAFMSFKLKKLMCHSLIIGRVLQFCHLIASVLLFSSNEMAHVAPCFHKEIKLQKLIN
jgi:hypothetical protein